MIFEFGRGVFALCNALSKVGSFHILFFPRIFNRNRFTRFFVYQLNPYCARLTRWWRNDGSIQVKDVLFIVEWESKALLPFLVSCVF